jgi:hypothetical protein
MLKNLEKLENTTHTGKPSRYPALDFSGLDGKCLCCHPQAFRFVQIYIKLQLYVVLKSYICGNCNFVPSEIFPFARLEK